MQLWVTDVLVFGMEHASISLGYVLSSGLLRSFRNCVFKVLRKHQTVFQRRVHFTFPISPQSHFSWKSKIEQGSIRRLHMNACIFHQNLWDIRLSCSIIYISHCGLWSAHVRSTWKEASPPPEESAVGPDWQQERGEHHRDCVRGRGWWVSPIWGPGVRQILLGLFWTWLSESPGARKTSLGSQRAPRSPCSCGVVWDQMGKWFKVFTSGRRVPGQGDTPGAFIINLTVIVIIREHGLHIHTLLLLFLYHVILWQALLWDLGTGGEGLVPGNRLKVYAEFKSISLTLLRNKPLSPTSLPPKRPLYECPEYLGISENSWFKIKVAEI